MNLHRILLNLNTDRICRSLMRNVPFQKEEIENLQLNKLRRLVVHAYENHPFYRRHFDDSGFNPYEVDSVSQLEQLPVLTKSEYRQLIEDALSADPGRYAGWSYAATSGSSGNPLRVVRTWHERAYMNAKWLRVLKLNGYTLADRYFRLTAKEYVLKRSVAWWQKVGLYRMHYFSCYSAPKEMYEAYQAVKPSFLCSLKTPLLQMAQYALENGLPLHQPRIYFVGGEVLDECSREFLMRALGAEGFRETYGCEELGIIGFQADKSHRLQLSHDTNIIECQGAGLTAGGGECLLTDLHISSFPLIRYELGDSLTTETDPETQLPVIREVKGRTGECAVWKNGSETNIYVFDEVLAYFSKEIIQFRVIQESYELCRVFVVPTPEYRPAERQRELAALIIEKMQRLVRPDVEYVIEFVDVLPADPGGKLRMLISHVKKQG